MVVEAAIARAQRENPDMDIGMGDIDVPNVGSMPGMSGAAGAGASPSMPKMPSGGGGGGGSSEATQHPALARYGNVVNVTNGDGD